MKLTYEDKVQIYELRKQGVSYARLADTFGINARNLVYMIKLIDRYGLEIVLNTVFQGVRCFITGSHNTRKISILLLRKQEGDYLRWDVSQRKNQKR